MNRLNYFVRIVASAMIASCSFAASAQAPAATPEPAADAAPSPASTTLEDFAWLRGCWAGNIDRYDFVEQWLPPRAGMLVGVSHTIVQDQKPASEARTEGYTYLRLEARADGIYYVAIPSGRNELPFMLTGVEVDRGDKVFTFSNPGGVFPQRIIYRHSKGGLLFAHVEGKVNGRDKRVIYPMHPVDCVTGKPTLE
jgi:Domain of unknown function (DUF6265)